jgi:SAM-dependent methyltransferase
VARRPYLQPYVQAVRRHGAEFEALLWRSPEFQRVRFQVISELVCPAGRAIADLGCGRGDLCAFLEGAGIRPRLYVGVEGVPELLDAARDCAPAATGTQRRFILGDFVRDEGLFTRLVREEGVEVLVFSGSLNTLSPGRARRTLERAWSAVGRVSGGALVFNFLSARVEEPAGGDDPARRFDAGSMVRWALSRTPIVVLRHDYLGGRDATIAMRPPDG